MVRRYGWERVDTRRWDWDGSRGECGVGVRRRDEEACVTGIWAPGEAFGGGVVVWVGW